MRLISFIFICVFCIDHVFAFHLEDRRYYRGYDITIPENRNSQENLFRVYYNDVRDLPTALYQGLKSIFPKRKGKIPVALMLTMTNDFNVLKVFGLQIDTDDFGYTHGTQLTIVGSLPNGKTLTFDYSTDLYTQPITGTMIQLPNGGRQVDQFFTDENIFRFIFSNQNKNRLFYWRTELGWQELNSQIRGDYRFGSNQQLKFHEYVNSFNVTQTKYFRNFENGKPFRQGPLFGLYLGMNKVLLNYYRSCQFEMDTEIGRRESRLNGADLNTLKIQFINQCLSRSLKNTYQFVIGSEMTEHSLGQQNSQYIDGSWANKNWKIGFRFELPSGDLINYQDYNLLNYETGEIDPLFKIYLQRKLN